MNPEYLPLRTLNRVDSEYEGPESVNQRLEPKAKRLIISTANEPRSNKSESEETNSVNSVVKNSELESEIQKPPDIVENIQNPSKRLTRD